MEKRNHYRDIIINEKLMDYINLVEESDRNKELVKLYINGYSYKELSLIYNVTYNRIPQIIGNYIRHVYSYKRKI